MLSKAFQGCVDYNKNGGLSDLAGTSDFSWRASDLLQCDLLVDPPSNRGSEWQKIEKKEVRTDSVEDVGKNDVKSEKVQEKSCEISIDWVTFCCHKDKRSDMQSLIFETFGLTWEDSKITPESPRNGYSHAFKCKDLGLYMAVGHEYPIADTMVCLHGRACQSLGFGGVSELIKAVKNDLEGRVTRLDVAIDFYGGVESLLSDVQESCKNGNLCRVKSWSPVVTYSYDEVKTGETVYLGSRKSERFVRVYDKGLETKTLSPGCWVRWEAVFKGAVSDHLSGGRDVGVSNSLMLLGGGVVDCKEVLNFLACEALRVAEFREQGSDLHIDRRSRVSWYDDLCLRAVGDDMRPKTKIPRNVDARQTEEWIALGLSKIRAFKESAGVDWETAFSYFDNGKTGKINGASDMEIVKGLREYWEVLNGSETPF